LKCLLHPDNETRKHYDALGFGVCKKSNLVSEFQVDQHMQKKHKAEYKTIQAEIAKKEKDDDRAFQRAMLNRITA